MKKQLTIVILALILSFNDAKQNLSQSKIKSKLKSKL